MPTTAFLIRWNGGWHEYVDLSAWFPWVRSEAFLSLGAVQSVPEARRLARAEMENQFGRVREQITTEHRPDGLIEIPYVAYRPGDSRITAPNFDDVPDDYEVVSMTVTENDDGEVTFVPTIGDNILDSRGLQRQYAPISQPITPHSGQDVDADRA